MHNDFNCYGWAPDTVYAGIKCTTHLTRVFPGGVTPQVWFADEMGQSKYGLTRAPESKRPRIADPACVDRRVEEEEGKHDKDFEEPDFEQMPHHWQEAAKAASRQTDRSNDGGGSSRQRDRSDDGGRSPRQRDGSNDGGRSTRQRVDSNDGCSATGSSSYGSRSDFTCGSNCTGPPSVGPADSDEGVKPEERLTSSDIIIIIVGIVTIIIIVSLLLILSAAS